MPHRQGSGGRLLVLQLFLCICAPLEVVAQTVGTSTGTIAGALTDETGAVLPDVSVSLSGPALMGTRRSSTDRSGAYLITALPPGEYVVVFERAGFRRVVSDPVRVTVGFTVTVDAVLQVAAVDERVIVASRSGVVDGRSTSLAVTYDAEQLASLPGSRSMFAILSSTPGVQVQRFEVGGNSGDAGGQYAAYGTRGFNRPLIEGINVSGIFPIGFTVNHGAFEEVSVGTGAHGPDWPWPGVQMQFIAKSGGNRYSGSIYADYEHPSWQSHNIDAGQRHRGSAAGGIPPSREANRLWRYYDLNADIGGFIKRDALWWYSSARNQDVQIRQVNSPASPSRTSLTNYTGKVTHRPLEKHTLIVFVQTGSNYQPMRLDPFGPSGGLPLNAATAIHDNVDSTSTQRASGVVWKAEWNGFIKDRLFLEVRGGRFDADRPSMPNGKAPRFEDIETLLVRGGGRDRVQSTRRPQLSATGTFFRDRWLGSHAFKAGAEISESLSSERIRAPFPGGVLHVTRTERPAEVYLFLAPSDSSSGAYSVGFHAGDVWRIHNRLTLNLGVRFDRYRVFLPEQTHPTGGIGGQPLLFPAVDTVLVWNLVAPRAGLILDLFGGGRTIAKLSYSWYWLPPADLGPNVNPNATEWWRRHRWHDANQTGLWEPGEEGLLLGRRGGFAVESIHPALKAPRIDEIAASIEQELPGALGVRTAVVWRGDRHRYARQDVSRPFEQFTQLVAIADPGPDGVLGTADDGRAMTGYNLDPRSLGQAPINIVRNMPSRASEYVTWEVLARRRLAGRWSLMAGFAHTWVAEHANSYSGQNIRENAVPLTPNDLINTAAGGRHQFRTWSATLSGTYRAPWNLQITPLVRHQSGQPFGRTIAAQMNFGTIRILAEPIGTRRMDNVTLADVRLERGFHLPNGGRFAAFVDLFNVFNVNPEQNINWGSGAAFLQPLSIVSPRIARVGLKLVW